MLFQQILNGLTNGSLYALMAVGVTMVYKSLGMLNFAHGDIMMVGTFITLTFITKLGLPFYVSVPLGIICAAGLGFLLERVILRKVKFSSFVNLLIATVGVSYVLRNASMVIWGTNPQLFPSMFPSELIEIGEFRITPQSIGIIIISLAIITGLHFFFTKVKIGKCMQLANSDPEGAAMMGVNVTYMRFLTFGISAALACIAGVMIAPLTYARVDMSATIGMKAFAAAILGGIGNLWGALLGGIILGIVEAVGSAYISTAYCKEGFIMTRTKKSAALLKILVIAAILILLPIVTPNMYIMQIINMIGIYIILGIGINVLTGYTGQLSLGQAAFFGIGAYTAALMNTRAGLQFIPCLLGSVVVTAFFGVVLAIPALKVKGSYLALLTMGFGEVVRIVMINWTPVTNGTAGVLGIQSPVIFGFSFDTLKKYYFLILLFVLLGLAYESIIIRTRTGRAFIAVREDNEAAELTGIDVTAYKIKAFVLSAVYCGIAGCLYAMMIKYVSPDTFVSNTSSVILWTAIVGGFGTVIGPVLGGIIMQVLPEALRFLGDWRLVVYGLILLVVILRFPGGLYPYIKRFVDSHSKKQPASAETKEG